MRRTNNLKRCKILVVEDEYFIADDVSRALTSSEVEVLGPVATVDDALKIIKSGQKIDAAVLDINLQGELVFSLADELKTRDVPFIFTTGYARNIVPERHRGVPHYEKPFNLKQLIATLPAIIGHPC